MISVFHSNATNVKCHQQPLLILVYVISKHVTLRSASLYTQWFYLRRAASARNATFPMIYSSFSFLLITAPAVPFFRQQKGINSWFGELNGPLIFLRFQLSSGSSLKEPFSNKRDLRTLLGPEGAPIRLKVWPFSLCKHLRSSFVLLFHRRCPSSNCLLWVLF